MKRVRADKKRARNYGMGKNETNDVYIYTQTDEETDGIMTSVKITNQCLFCD